MSPTLTATVTLSVTGKQVQARDLGSEVNPFAKAVSLAFANGTGAGQADRVFADTRTLIASATEDLDLAGVLVDGDGATITFAKIKGVLLFADEANVNDVVVTRPATLGVPLMTAVSSGRAVRPGGFDGWACPGPGIAVTPATGDLLTITNGAGGTPVTYTIVIIGTSA